MNLVPLTNSCTYYLNSRDITAIIIDNKGHIDPTLKEERVLSAIIEFKIYEESGNYIAYDRAPIIDLDMDGKWEIFQASL